MTLQHVGWRCYQPSIGRFIQRDPLGLRAGLNLYAYVDGNPTGAVDPAGFGAVGIGPDVFEVPLKYLPNLGKLPVTPKLILETPLKTLLPYATTCVVAWEIGWQTGEALDWAVGQATGTRISEWVGEKLADACPTCWDWVWW